MDMWDLVFAVETVLWDSGCVERGMWREFVLLVGGSVELVAASWALHASVRHERQGLWRMVLVLWPVGFREHPGCAE